MKIELGQVQRMLEWLKTKLYLDSIAQNARSRAIKRGQVYRCNFGCGIGSEMQKERPAVIIQNDLKFFAIDSVGKKHFCKTKKTLQWYFEKYKITG